MNKLTAFFKLIRITNLAIIAISLSLFYYLIIVPVHHDKLQISFLPFPPFRFVLFVISVMCIAAAGNIINDYFDLELDKAYKPERPLAAGHFSLDTAMYLHVFFAGLGIALGFYLGYKVNYTKIGYLYVVSAVVLYVYSAQLKKLPLAGNIIVALLSAFVFVLLMVFESAYLSALHATELIESTPFAFSIITWQVKIYAGFAFLTSLAREIVKDIEDRDGDADFNIETLPVQFGVTTAKIVATLTLLILLAAVGFMINGFWHAHALKESVYLIVAVVLPVVTAIVLVIAAKQQKQYARVSMLLKVIMLLGILSIPAFYLFNL